MNVAVTAARQPVIILGMHRSGTSMLTDVLEACGLWCGWRKDPNQEAWFFLTLNDWLVQRCGGSWEFPAPVHAMLDNVALRALLGEYLAFLLRTPRVVSYLGPRRFLRYRSPLRLTQPWGWKDPRNTFTLPLWLDLFPGAKVLNIQRHGVDVVQSLMTRQRDAVAIGARLFAQRKPLYWLGVRQPSFALHVRCTSPEGCFATWEEYSTEAARHVAALGSRAMTVRFEDVVQAPREHLLRMLAFCDVPARPALLDKACAGINPARACAYKKDPALCALAERMAARLRVFGY
jgi:hypothetical protein